MIARELMCGLNAVQNGLAEAPVNKSRKQIKERKNRTKKIRGVKKNAGMRCYPQSAAWDGQHIRICTAVCHRPPDVQA